MGQPYSEIQERAAWILAHMLIVSSKYAKEVVNAGGISPFVYLMDSNNSMTKEESLRSLQEMTLFCKKYRDYAIANGMITKIVKIVMFDKTSMNIEHRVAQLINAISMHSDISIDALKELLPAIKKLLSSENDEAINQILQSMFFTMNHDDNDDEISQLFLDYGMAQKLVPFLDSENFKFRAIALPVIANLCSNNPEKIKIFLDLGILQFLPKLLNHKDTRENALILWSRMKSDEELKEILKDYEINETPNTKMEL
uniref:Uncharacterized protein n=1 Tax=Panagrolaimus superbus TaxID=310955 RepID=A0A914YV62_9BILA